MADIDLKCDKCGKLLHAEAGGERIRCKYCGQRVRVPRSFHAVGQPNESAGFHPEVPADVQVDDDAGALGAMGALMPWTVSVVFHVGLLLVMTFFAFMTANAPADDDADMRIIIKTPPGNAPPQLSPPPFLPAKREMSAVDDLMAAGTVSGTAPGRAGRPSQQFERWGDDIGRPDIIGVVSGDETWICGHPNLSLPPGGRLKFVEMDLAPPDGRMVNKVAFLVDNSGSMYRNFKYVQAELLYCISKLDSLQEFTVVFFSSGRPTELKINGRGGLHFANDANKAAAKEWIEKIVCGSTGQTDPSEAIKLALSSGDDRPELVFLLTDGLFPNSVIELARRLNADKKARINTIMYVDRSPDAEKQLKTIAADSGGQYRFMSEEELGRLRMRNE